MPAANNTHEARRARLVKLIHVAKRDLRLDEPTYRALLQAAGGADSTARMDAVALDRVLTRMKRAGFKVRHNKAPTLPAMRRASSRPLDTSEQARKVRALWLFLHTLGVVRSVDESSLAAYVKRITGVDDLHWTHSGQLARLIETLKKWLMRYLPQANVQLCVQAMSTPLDARQMALAQQARAWMDKPTFDAHWRAWSLWCLALGREVPEPLLYARSGEIERATGMPPS